MALTLKGIETGLLSGVGAVNGGPGEVTAAGIVLKARESIQAGAAKLGAELGGVIGPNAFEAAANGAAAASTQAKENQILEYTGVDVKVILAVLAVAAVGAAWLILRRR